MEIVGTGFHFEDLYVGRRFKTVGRTITDADIVNYVNCTGLTEVLFTDAGSEARISRGRSDRGLVRTRNEIEKQDGTKVITYTPLRMVKRRTAAQA